MTFGKRAAIERKRQGRTQEAVAHDSGVTVGTYSRIERGEINPSLDTARGIARALRTSLDSLLDGTAHEETVAQREGVVAVLRAARAGAK